MITAIVLAAGQGSRLGKRKQLMPLNGKPLLQHALDRVNESAVDDIVVVLGAFADEIRKQIKFNRERIVINPDYERGMSTSLQAGLRAVGDAEAAIIALGDQPFVEAKTIDALVEEYRRSQSPIVVPTYDGRRGNPVLIDRSLFERAMEIRGDVGFRAVFGKDKVAEVPVSDSGVIIDIDTMEDFECRTRHSS
ncbi:MAG: nucleotidyltransferase family protein [Acidobacteriota bacterium]|nr:nucleotidyltransferase family protein [Acidobacteriota bacterium]